MRRRASLVISAAILAACSGLVVPCALAQQGEVAAAPSQLDKFMRIRTPGGADVTPAGALFVTDWPDGVNQIYRAPRAKAGPGEDLIKVSNFPDGVSGYSISPDGTRMLVLAATGGNENTQIYAATIAKDGTPGPILPIAQDPKVQFAASHWLADGSGFLYHGNVDSPNDFHLYLHTFANGNQPAATTKILAREGSWDANDITADKARALVSQDFSASNSVVYQLDLHTSELKDLSIRPEKNADGTPGTAAQSIVGFMPGEQAILQTSDIEDGMSKLFLRDLATGKVVKPLPDLDRFELDAAGMSPDRSVLYTLTNEDGYGVLRLYRLPGFEAVPLPKIEPGVVSVRRLTKDSIIYSLSNARTPGLSFRYSIPPVGASAAITPPQQLTFPHTQGIDLASFALPDLIRYRAFDGKEIPAFLFLPPGYRKGTPLPFIVNYHGGPEGQHRPSYSSTIQYLLSEGFGIIQPNVRGSSGYGRAFQMLDDYKGRWDSVRDGVDAAEWLVQMGYARPGKIATWGGSYGGYMSVACVVEDQERVEAGKRKERLFGAGVNVVGITNVKTFLEKTSGYRRKLREVEYGPLSDPDFLSSVSPMNRIDKMQIPMFIAHGFNDPRVPVEEAMQMAVALKDRALAAKDMNRMPMLFIAPDEGHGFAKLDNRLLYTSRMSAFLKDKIAK